MKKITLCFAAFLMAAICANAQTINNPKDANGYYIVKWDCENDAWATSNDFEVDEAFTFAVDITGTAFEDWLKTPTNAGGTRSIAVNKWTGFGDFDGDTHRLKQIKGNIYGATWCFTQMANTFDVVDATEPGEVTYFFMQVFGFEYTPEDSGALWWQWPAGWLAEGTTIDAVEGVAFTSAPYTGTKTSVEFYCDDYAGFWTYISGGYAPSCTAIDRAEIGYKLTINNPKDANGYYIVKWDCAKNSWATSNDFEVDEAFTFAIDITGTELADWIRTPTNAGGARSIAVNKWSGFGDFNGASHRLKRIKGNIYGATWCFSQLANTFKVEDATKPGEVTYFMMTVFGFEYTPEDAGALWWQLPMDINAVDGSAFTSAPYTGTKTSEDFASNDYEGFWPYTVGGYAPTCALDAGALTIKNPKDANGYYIVKWDCGKNTWAASNSFEVDQAFTFAVDITGTALADWVKTPTNADGTRSIGVNRWSGFGDFNGDANRLKLIEENIYGTTWCFTQMANSFKVEDATKPGEVTYFMMTIFGFEYTPEDAGALWWQLPMDINAVDGSAFTSAPYTGTQTSGDFAANEFAGFWTSAAGYAPACAAGLSDESGILPVAIDSPVVGLEYYNLQGMRLARQPESGLFIVKAIKENGTSVATKILIPSK